MPLGLTSSKLISTRVTINRVARTEDSESTSRHLQQTLSRYSIKNPDAVSLSGEQQEQTTNLVPHQQKETHKGSRKTASEKKQQKQKQRFEQGRQLQQQPLRMEEGYGDKEDEDTAAETDNSGTEAVEPQGHSTPSSRRSKQIDSERVPIEYNPSEVAVSSLLIVGSPSIHSLFSS